ncbi:MAG: hypothetical protein A3E01_19765 [Gammaproteobacteria bacterium RIFCSPHIGHO2_12_FULL_63_22]|nr:MAG: hypothetical protein A3E01_19765 [Gammaproteobacteria bacterium RIFCSPHIGHO2_12_FULL_63_22]
MQKQWLATVALVALAASAGASADGSSVGVGFDYSSGKYGATTTTDIWSVPFIFGYDTGPWSLKLTVPYINVSGSGNVIPGLGGTENRNPNGRGRNGQSVPTTDTEGSASGLGDVVAAASYALVSNPKTGFGLDLTGKVKFGTADADQGLGSGQNDYTLGVDAYQARGDWTVFGGASYAMLGDSEFLQLDDVFGANLGASYKLNDASSWGAVFDYRQRASDKSQERNELTAFYNHKVGDSTKWQAYVLSGFSDGSPDWGGGLSVKHGF